MLICCVNLYGLDAYKIAELCNPNSRYISFEYLAPEIHPQVTGHMMEGRIKVGNKVFLGVKTVGTTRALVVRDGIIKYLHHDGERAHISVFMNPYVSLDRSLDIFLKDVGKASMNRFCMYGG